MNIERTNNDEFSKNIEQISQDEMRNSLSCIAQELLRFHDQTYNPTVLDWNKEVFGSLMMVKTNLQSKKTQVKKLRKNLKTACIVARTAIYAKDNDSMKVTNELNILKNQYEDLLKKDKCNSKAIDELTSDNERLKHKIDAYDAFVALGFKQLQKMRNLPVQKKSAMHQLKDIITSCGQYYADYSNECEENAQLIERNRLLSHKIEMMSNNLETATEELQVLKGRNLVNVQKDNNARTESCTRKLHFIQSNYYVDENITTDNSENSDDSSSRPHTKWDFTSHLSLVKIFLDNQDNMLKDLKKISEELIITEHSTQ